MSCQLCSDSHCKRTHRQRLRVWGTPLHERLPWGAGIAAELTLVVKDRAGLICSRYA